jgi:hypothetical protein
MSSSRMAVSTSNTLIGHRFAHVSVNVRPWVYAGVVLCLIVSLGFVYLIQAGHVARQVEQMELLEVDVQRLKRANSALLLEIAQSEQVARTKQRARQMGFSEPSSVEYVVVQMEERATRGQDPVTRSNPDARRALSTDPMAAASQGSWRHTLMDQLSDWMKVSAAP